MEEYYLLFQWFSFKFKPSSNFFALSLIICLPFSLRFSSSLIISSPTFLPLLILSNNLLFLFSSFPLLIFNILLWTFSLLELFSSFLFISSWTCLTNLLFVLSYYLINFNYILNLLPYLIGNIPCFI